MHNHAHAKLEKRRQDQVGLKEHQDAARKARLGIWADGDAVDSDEEDDGEMHLSDAFKGRLAPISKENEFKVWTYLENTIDQALAKYPTTLKEDLQLLNEDIKEKKLSTNERNCLLFRKDEKKVLTFIKNCSNIVKILL